MPAARAWLAERFRRIPRNFPIPLIHPERFQSPRRFAEPLLAWGRRHTHSGVYPCCPSANTARISLCRVRRTAKYLGVALRRPGRSPEFFSADARFPRTSSSTPKILAALVADRLQPHNHFNALAVHDNSRECAVRRLLRQLHRRIASISRSLYRTRHVISSAAVRRA